MSRAPTISDAYLRMQQKLHELPNYGIASLAFAHVVADVIREGKIKSVTDYGAGKQNLLKGLEKEGVTGFAYAPYDPAFPEYGLPRPSELVCCIDVLEHIEPELLENVIKELASLTQRFGFFSIHLGPAGKVLEDGRNAHLIQQPKEWWLTQLNPYFEVRHVAEHQAMGLGIWLIVAPRV